MQDACEHIDFLEFTVFDGRIIGGIDAIIMVIMYDVAVKIFRTRGLVDSFNIPIVRLVIQDVFNFSVMIKSHYYIVY